MGQNKSVVLQVVIAGDASKLGKTIKGAETQVVGLGAQLRGLAPKVAAGLTSAAVLKWTKDAVGSYKQVVGEVAQLKRVTGETAENASLIRFAAQQAGIPVQKMATAWGIFSKNLSNGAVEKAGIDIRDVNGELLDSEKILAKVADRFAGMADGPEKTALALKLFGRGGADMIKVLNQGSAGIAQLREEMARLGLEVSPDDIDQFKKYTAAQRDFQAASTGLKQTVGRELLPALTALAESASEDLPKVTKGLDAVTNAAGAVGKVTGLSGVAGAVIGPLVGVGVAVTGVGIASLTIVPAAKAGALALRDLGVAAVTTGTNLVIPTAAVNGLTSAEVEATAATDGLTAAQNRAKAASIGVGGVITAGLAGLMAYNTTYAALEARWQSGIDTSNLQEDLALFGEGASDGQRILDQYGGSIETLAGKVTALADAYENSGWENLTKGSNTEFGNTHRIKKELEDLDGALAALAKSDPDAASATYRKLSAALTEQGVAAKDIATVFPKYNDQVERSADANKKGGDAAKKHADEQKKLGGEVETTAQKFAKAVDESGALYNQLEAVDQAGRDVNAAVIAVADAQDAVADAEQGVADAQDEVAAAQERVAEARRGVATAEAAVADARKGVDTATRGLAEAERDAADAREAITAATEDMATAEREATGDSDDMRAALAAVDDAEAKLAEAQQNSLDAQEALTAAREGYGQTMKDLATDVAAATDDVTLAEIAIRDAQAKMAEVNADPTATADERTKAEIAVREAQRRLEEIKRRLAEAQATYDRNNAGVDTSDAVVAAQDAVTAAADAQADAQERLEGAVQDVADTQVAANDRVAEAQDNLAEAIDRRAQADQRVVDARDAVVDAQNRVRDAAQGVEAAHRNVASALDGVNEANQRVVDAREAVVKARHDVRDAEAEVTEKLRDQAVKQFELDQKTRGAATATSIFKARLDEIGATLDPNTPTARNLATYAALLGYITQTYPSVAAALASLGPTAPPGAQNAERQGRSTGGGKSGPGSTDRGPADGKPPRTEAPAGPTTYPGGWVLQPNGTWYHPRQPGEENYGDGYTRTGPPELLKVLQEAVARQAAEARAAAEEAAARAEREHRAERGDRGKAGDKPEPTVLQNVHVEINFPDVTDGHTAAIITDRYLATSLNQRARAS